MHLKKTAIAVLIFILAVSVFSGCSRKDGTNPVTIQVAAWDATTMSYLPVLLDNFKWEHPELTVEILDIASVDYTQKLTVMLNGGSKMDAFWIKDADTVPGLVNRDQLAELNGYIQKDKIDLDDFNGLAGYFIWGGSLRALPTRSDYYVLYYNKDIFDRAGVPYPSNNLTWADWEKLAGRLSSGRGNDKIYGGLLHTWQACVQNWAVQDGQHTIMNTDYSFFKPYYEMALRMQKAGSIWDFGELKTAGIHYSSAFLQGKTATMPMGTWFMSTIIDRIDKGEAALKWGIAALPHPTGIQAGWTVGSVTPIAINKASANKDEAWEFVKFITGDIGAIIYAAGNAFPGRANSQTLLNIANAPGMPAGALDALMVKHISLDRPYQDLAADVNQMLGEVHSLIMLGEVTIDQGLAKMAQRSKEIQGK